MPRRLVGSLERIYPPEQLCPPLSQRYSYSDSILRYLRKTPCLLPTSDPASDRSIV